MSCDITFVPRVDLCINNKCNSLCIKELTDVLQTPYNTTGWGPTNPTTDLVNTANIFIYNEDGTVLLETFIVKDNTVNLYPNLTPTPFVLTNDFPWTQQDGVFKVLYEVVVGATTYTNGSQYSLFICNLLNCKDELVRKIITECNDETLAEYKHVLDQLEVLILGIESAFSCKEFEKVNNLIAAARTICQEYNCDCGCGC